MNWKALIFSILVTTLLISPAWSLDQVSPKTGKVVLTQTDHYLVTPVGPLPIVRSFRSDTEAGIMGLGWTLDIVSRLNRLSDRLLVITQAGKATLLAKKDNNKEFVGPYGVAARFKKDQWIVESPTNITSIFDKQGREVSWHDANGNIVSFAYDRKGRLSEIQAVKGYLLRFIYGDNGLLAAIRDAGGRQSVYRYDTAGRMVEAQDANGWRTTYCYKKNGMPAEINYPSGIRVSFKYDESKRVIKRISSSGPTYTYSYGKVNRITRQDGFWWETEYDKKGRPLRYHDCLNREQGWYWNDQGQLIRRRFLDGTHTDYTYDSQGRMVRQETGHGDTLKIFYDGSSPRPAMIDHNGAVTRFRYDKKGNPLAVTSPA